jgi:hypothetical protein
VRFAWPHHNTAGVFLQAAAKRAKHKKTPQHGFMRAAAEECKKAYESAYRVAEIILSGR